MIKTFEISYWWEKLSEPDYFVELVDTTRVSLALDYFLSLYQGQFEITIRWLDTCFDLSPDLPTIFKEIPLVLEQLTTDTESPVEFNFFEQGTAVVMWMERQGTEITVRFEPAPGAGQAFMYLPDTKIPVLADEFLDQWLQFVRAVLDALVNLQPDLVNDESYHQYRSQLDVVESRLVSSFNQEAR
jgi:hypothetical protein